MRSLLIKNQNGTAMFIAVMMLVLSTGLGLLAFHVSTSELQISSYTKGELSATYLAEAGVEKVLSWVSNPAGSPDPPFFSSLTKCSKDSNGPDFQTTLSTTSDHFSELKGMGEVVDLRLYKSSNPDGRGICTIESKAKTGTGATKTVKVEFSRSPLGPLTAGIQGNVNPSDQSPIWVHWGIIRYRGDANLGKSLDVIPVKNTMSAPNSNSYSVAAQNDTELEDAWLEIHVQKNIQKPSGGGEGGNSQPYPGHSNLYQNEDTVLLDSVKLPDLKSFIMKYGHYYTVSPTGSLQEGGINRGSFDEVFNIPGKDYGLVWVDNSPNGGAQPISIGRGSYKGYFYFTGDIRIDGDEPGRTAQAHSPPWPGVDPQSKSIELDNINLDGFFYVQGRVDLKRNFNIYGAVYAGEGFAGLEKNVLEVWYNDHFKSAAYIGLPALIRLKGTWLYIIPT